MTKKRCDFFNNPFFGTILYMYQKYPPLSQKKCALRVILHIFLYVPLLLYIVQINIQV